MSVRVFVRLSVVIARGAMCCKALWSGKFRWMIGKDLEMVIQTLRIDR